jgi:DNA-binding NtrC family response regulator
MERAYILERGEVLSPQSFPREIMTVYAPVPAYVIGSSTLKDVRKRAVEEAERRYLVDILKLNQGRIDKSASTAGITTRQLRKLMRRYGIRKEEFKPPTRTRPKRALPEPEPRQAQVG